MNRIVIFTGDASAFSVRWGIAELAHRFPAATWLVLEHRPLRTLRTVIRNQWRRCKREGWRYLPDLLANIWRRGVNMLRTSDAVPCAPGRAMTLEALRRHPKMSFIRSTDIHGAEALEEVRSFEPDLGIALAAPILKPELFEIPQLGTINLHKGKLPDFRGMPPAFWEIVTGAGEVGCSIHKVERKLDTGPILLRTTLPV